MTVTGPFVVTHYHFEEKLDAHAPVRFDDYREAFATMELAVMHAWARVADRTPASEYRTAWPAFHEVEAALAGPNGRIELPDGSVIEVEATTYETLGLAIPGEPGGNVPLPPPRMWSDSGRASCLRAWNAEHGIGLEARA